MRVKFKNIAPSTLLIIIPILYFNSCTMGFIKNYSFVLPMVLLATIGWIVVYACERGRIERVGALRLIPIIAVIMFLFLLLVLNLGDNISTLGTSIKNNIFTLFFMFVFVAYSDSVYAKDRALIVRVWCLDTVVSCIYTIYRLDNDPLLSRYMSMGSFYESEMAATVGGIISFGHVYGLVLISVALLAIARQRKKGKLSCIFLLVVYGLFIIKAQFMISIILLLVGLVYVVLIYRSSTCTRVLKFAILIVTGGLVLLLLPQLLSWIVHAGFMGDALNQRLEEIQSLLIGNQLSTTSDLLLRFEKYLTSISAFWKSFGLGALCNKSVVAGEHSEILDGFANYGIAFAVYIFAILSFYKYIKFKLVGESLEIYKIVFCFFIVMSLLNTSTWAPTMMILFVIIPFMCLNEIKTENLVCLE